MTTDIAMTPAPLLGAPAPRWAHLETRLGASWRRTPTRWVVVGAAVAVVVRLPYLGTPAGPDEGGFLLVASQWRAGGRSLYGDYWVDRPPLLIAFFAGADGLGGVTALRLMGCVLAFSVVVLSHLLGREVTRSAPSREKPTPWPAILAIALVSTPLTGSQAVNGELIAVPVLLLGLLIALQADRMQYPPLRRMRWAVAGSLGMVAAMVKQNFTDVFVFGFVLLIATAWTRRVGTRGVGRGMRYGIGETTALMVGGALTGSAILLAAAFRGTTPLGVWDALVVFRVDAGTVIAQSASSATPDRLLRLLLMLCLSGGIVVMMAFAIHAWHRLRQPLVVATLALLGWELVGVLGGGSYWLHYLLGLIPGLVLAIAQLAASRGRNAATARAAVVYAAAVALLTATNALIGSASSATTPPAAVWLKGHAEPGDTATVLYGAPNILQATDLSSPYPQLWSLPVRVRDPHLTQLQAVLEGPHPPTWLLAPEGLATWGVSAESANAVVTGRYQLIRTVDGYTIYHLRTTLPAIPTAAHHRAGKATS